MCLFTMGQHHGIVIDSMFTTNWCFASHNYFRRVYNIVVLKYEHNAKAALQLLVCSSAVDNGLRHGYFSQQYIMYKGGQCVVYIAFEIDI